MSTVLSRCARAAAIEACAAANDAAVSALKASSAANDAADLLLALSTAWSASTALIETMLLARLLSAMATS